MLTDDLTLLREFAATQSETAFAELVQRHVNLVYSAARRRTGDDHLAEEITQAVFIILARKAGAIGAQTILTGWLYRTIQYAAADALRQQRRRLQREHQAFMEATLTPNETDDAWKQIAPVLDGAMDALNERDRNAVLLRYFENKPLAEVGAALGVSEDAARVRVNRALEKLRATLTKSGVTLGVTTIAGAVTANAIQAAPMALAASITAAALTGTSLTLATLAMTTLQKIAVTAALTATIGAGIYQAKQAANARDEARALKQQQAPMAEQIQELQRQQANDASTIAGLKEDLARNDDGRHELLKLRGQAGQLQSQLELLKKSSQPANDMSPDTLVGRINLLKAQLKKHPEWSIPEIQFFNDRDWIDIASQGVNMVSLTDEDGIRHVLSSVRRMAKSKFGQRLWGALQRFAADNSGSLPSSVSLLKPYLDQQKMPTDFNRFSHFTRGGPPSMPQIGFQNYPPADETLLARYQMVASGNTNSLRPNQYVLAEKMPVDNEYDTLMKVGLGNLVTTGVGKDHSLGHSGTPDLTDLTPKQLELYNKSTTSGTAASPSEFQKINSRYDEQWKKLSDQQNNEVNAYLKANSAVIHPNSTN